MRDRGGFLRRRSRLRPNWPMIPHVSYRMHMPAAIVYGQCLMDTTDSVHMDILNDMRVEHLNRLTHDLLMEEAILAAE